MEAQRRLGMTLYKKIVLLSLTGLCSLSLVASNNDAQIATLYKKIAQNQRDISEQKERQIFLLNHRIDMLQERLKNAGLQAQTRSDKGTQSEPILTTSNGIQILVLALCYMEQPLPRLTSDTPHGHGTKEINLLAKAL